MAEIPRPSPAEPSPRLPTSVEAPRGSGESDIDADDARPIFAIFEGGGAKGMAHVGAYAAADDMGLEFVGVAGASAGSIVAALIAVGLSPGDIFDPKDPQRNIFATHHRSPIDVLGAREWRMFRRLRAVWTGLGVGLCVSLGATLGCALLGWVVPARVAALTGAALSLIALSKGRALMRQRGIFDPAHFAREFNRVLYDRVRQMHVAAGGDPAEVPATIRFRDIDVGRNSDFCFLKVVATDVSRQQLQLFDHTTPDVVVAEAVAASIAIPGVFKPARIPSYVDAGDPGAEDRQYADGGLVSNLPVWCFSEEKAFLERRTPHNNAVPIVAFTLDAGGEDPSVASLSPLGYFQRVVRTAIFGGQLVIQEFVRDLIVVPLQCRLGVLAFDAEWDDARRAFEAAKYAAQRQLRRRLETEPRKWRRTLAAVCGEARQAIEAWLRAAGDSRSTPLRAGVFEPYFPIRGQPATGPVTTYRVTHAFNMEEDADERLTLDHQSPGVPEAYRLRSVVLWSPGRDSAWPDLMTKYERALVRRSVKSVVCIPLFAEESQWDLPPASRKQPLGVIAFDSDEDIIERLKAEPTVLTLLTECTLGLSSLLADSQRE